MREMSFTLQAETRIYLLSVLLGAAVGVLWAAFRALRVLFAHKKAVVFVEDFIFAAIACFSAFVFATALTGKLRVYTVIGMLAGAVLENFFVGRPVIFALRKLTALFKRRLVKPLSEFIHKIGQKIKVRFVKNHLKLAKKKKNPQKPLKVDF